MELLQTHNAKPNKNTKELRSLSLVRSCGRAMLTVDGWHTDKKRKLDVKRSDEKQLHSRRRELTRIQSGRRFVTFCTVLTSSNYNIVVIVDVV